MAFAHITDGIILARVSSFTGVKDMTRVVQFTRPESLRCFSPTLLVELLKRYPELMEARGIRLPPDLSEDPMTYHRSTELLLCADEMAGQSASLCETLHLVEQLSSAQGRDTIIQMAQQHGITIAPEARSANHDLVLWAWLHHPCMHIPDQLFHGNSDCQLFSYQAMAV